MEQCQKLNKQDRNLSLDVLKILCFFGVTMIHFTGYSNLMVLENVSTFNKVVFSFLTSLARPAVNVFVLITGFFMCEKQFKISRLLKLWFQVFVVGVIGCVAVLIINQNISFADVIRTICPITTYSFWFMTNYFILMILSPFLNKLFNVIIQKQHLFLCFFGFVWMCVFVVMNPFVDTVKYFGTDWNISVFLILYIMGAYIKKYNISTKEKICILTLGVLCLICEFLIIFYQKNGSFFEVGNYSVYAFFVALSVFVLFKDLKINKGGKTISLLAKSSVFVYLVQEYLPFRNILWNIVNVSKYASSATLIFVYLILVICLWFVSVLISMLCDLFYPHFEKFVNFLIFKIKILFSKNSKQ